MPKSKAMLNAEAAYIKQKADEIETVLVKGVTLSYNPHTPYTPDMHKQFHKHFHAVVMVLKDRGFKLWGEPYISPGTWHIHR